MKADESRKMLTAKWNMCKDVCSTYVLFDVLLIFADFLAIKVWVPTMKNGLGKK